MSTDAITEGQTTPIAVEPREAAAQAAGSPRGPGEVWVSVATAAAICKVPYHPLRKRLSRWMLTHTRAWEEVQDGRSRAPRILFDLFEIQPVIATLRASTKKESASIDSDH